MGKTRDLATTSTVTDAEKSTWNGKQAALGFTPENVANKGVANGYAGIGADGTVSAAAAPTDAAHLTNKQYVDAQIALAKKYAP
jgi:hypothetical protein